MLIVYCVIEGGVKGITRCPRLGDGRRLFAERVAITALRSLMMIPVVRAGKGVKLECEERAEATISFHPITTTADKR